jgi:alpha-amylase
MGEWTLPSEAQVELYKIKEELKRLDLSERIQPRLRGGYWRQFLAKYPEAARIYRRMLRVSDKVAALERKKHPEAPKARKALLKGQANDALWHGVFGGIYLPHLRYAVGKELISAENICHHALKNPSHYEKDDSDMVIENGFLRCQISAELGGAISTLDVRAKGINLVDTIARRLEPYHIRMLEASTVNQDNHASIHERLELKEPDLAQKLAQDNHQRFCFIDRFLKSNFALEDLRYNREVEVGDFLNNDYFLLNDSKDSLEFKRTGTVKQKSLTLFKTFIFSQNSMEFKVKYGFKCDIKGLEDIWFAPELNINLMAPDAPDRFFLLNGEKFPGNNLGSTGDYSGILTLSLVDEYLKIRVDITAQSKPRWLWYPVESISLSEAGIERIYQGSAIHPLWKLQDICRTETEIKMNIKIW